MSAGKLTDRYSVGIDIGGTFTDVVLLSAAGKLLAKHKVDTTPSNLEACFINGLVRATQDRKSVV